MLRRSSERSGRIEPSSSRCGESSVTDIISLTDKARIKQLEAQLKHAQALNKQWSRLCEFQSHELRQLRSEVAALKITVVA